MSEKLIQSEGERAMGEITKLGDGAIGTIEASLDQQEKLAEMNERLASGEFLRAVDHFMVCGCIDGRCGDQLRASSAGGTISLLVADDLTTRRFSAGKNTKQALESVAMHLKEQDLPVGGHDDDHAIPPATGCGANDKLADIYYIMQQSSDQVKALAEAILETPIDVSVHQQLMDNVDLRLAEDNFSPSVELRQTLKDAQAGCVDTLRGEHGEKSILVNTRPNTTLSHDALAEEYGPDFGAFCVDAWALEPSAQSIAGNPEDADDVYAKVLAMVYFNAATGLKLCGPNMPVVKTVD